MFRGKVARIQHSAQHDAVGRCVGFAQDRTAHLIEKLELFVRPRGRVVGDVIRRANEPVERKNDVTMARMNKKRRDGKILVAMAFPGTKIGGFARHARVIV